MPRIVPLQLLKCLKVLLDDNGGILSAAEVKRIAGLMTKYSKKLVSKCIYVQILKCTKTELLGEFMGVGGWSLVYTWLNDAIRAMNWPLVQEILELLLLCPVDVHRLKINSAPKLVKGLCKDGGNEGVRILAKRLVEQWLKVVTENTAATAAAAQQQQTSAMTPQATPLASPPTAESAPSPQKEEPPTSAAVTSMTVPTKAYNKLDEQAEKDPLADDENEALESTNYALTPAQKKASEAGLVYKIVYKDGQQVLAKVAKTAQKSAVSEQQEDENNEEEDENQTNVVEDESEEAEDDEGKVVTLIDQEEDTSISQDKAEKYSESSGEEELVIPDNNKTILSKKSIIDDKKPSEVDKEKADKKELKSSKDSKDSKEREKERKSDKEKDKERRSSSSGHKSSSSSHKSSSSSSKSTSSSSSKSKSSSSSSRHSSSDKHRSDKERSSSSKDKERSKESSSSSSSKHRSSSSKISSSSSSSSSSKERHRDKDKEKSSSSSSSSMKKDKEREKDAQTEKDKDTLGKTAPTLLDKLAKIPKKSKEDGEADANKPTSITIPSKKASISIEIRRDTDKAKTVKTYKSQFRSHGLTEEAPPPPSRKGLKKPGSTAPAPGTVIPTSLPSSLKRPSPPPRDSPTEKKSKIDLNNVVVANEKPGAIKLIPAKKIQTLVETNLFSDALSAATGPKKNIKRKRPTTPAPGQGKEGPSPPTSPEAHKVTPLKFYQDTLDESKLEEKCDKENEAETKENANNADNATADKESKESIEDDDDIPLKKVKEDIEQKVLKEKSATATDAAIVIASDDDDEKKEQVTEEVSDVPIERKPGPGCGPNGPPGVLMLHRRKGPKKKLTWRPQEELEQIRFFELDETERCNVTKTSFMDMKNMERFSERDAINMSRRGFNHEDNMEIQTPWRALIEVDDVPPHPDGSQSKQRKVQADRELTTLRALYFSHGMIPDSPAEAELEPHYAHDIPVIPLDDITGNPDAVNDFTSMPWPEPKGSPKHGENAMVGTGGLGGLGSPVDMFSSAPPSNAGNPFNPFVANNFNASSSGNMPAQMQMQLQQQMGPQGVWQGSPSNNAAAMTNGPPAMIGNAFNGHGSPTIPMDMNSGPLGPGGPIVGKATPQNFMPPHGQFGPGPGPGPQQFSPQFGPPGFNGPNFGPLGPGGPMVPGLMNGMVPMPMGGPMMNGPGPNNRNNSGGNWRTGGSNFQGDNSGRGPGGGGIGNWRPAGSGPNRNNNSGNQNMNNSGNNGICKGFMRGHCRLGKACKYVHPKSKRI